MSWFNTGYDAAKEESKKGFEGSSNLHFFMKPKETVRGMFVDDDPISFWEHQFRLNGKWGGREPCHKKNRALAQNSGGGCPVCDSGDKMWPSFVGNHTFIVMTPFFGSKDNREFNFQRKIYGAKMGSEEKPGILKKLERLKTTHGRLRGLIFDIYRSGSKTESVGDEFTLVEKIEPANIESYGREQLAAYAKRLNEKLAAKDHVTVDQLWKRNPWVPFNFEKLMGEGGPLAPRQLGELRRLFSTGAAGGGGDDFGGEGGGRGGGGDGSRDGDGDESPY